MERIILFSLSTVPGLIVPLMQTMEAGKDRNEPVSDGSKPLDMEHIMDLFGILLAAFVCIFVFLVFCWTLVMMESSGPSSITATNAGENKVKIDT